jgi:putative spermidine/putrescine transport system permease protein
MGIHRPGWIATLLGLLLIGFLLLPLLAVVPVSFTPLRYLSMPQGAWSLVHYRELIEDSDWSDSLLLSLQIAVIASLAATTLATAFALGLWYFQPRLRGLLVGFVLLPMVIPPVVSAMTLYFFLTSVSQVSDWIGYDTWPGVALAHVVVIAPFAVVIVMVALAQLDRRIELAARGMGASLWQRTVRVILPNIAFGVASAALLSFVLSWEEIGVTLFITSVDAITLPRRIWMGLRDNIDPAVAAISVLLILLTTLVIAARFAWRAIAARRHGPLEAGA